MFVGTWALDMWENHNEAMRSEMFETLSIHIPLTSRAMHITEQREWALTLWNKSIDDSFVIGDVEELSWSIGPWLCVSLKITISKVCKGWGCKSNSK